MRVNIDPQRCQSTGFCVRVAPEIFALAGDGPTQVINPEPDLSLHDLAREAETLCPARAIVVENGA